MSFSIRHCVAVAFAAFLALGAIATAAEPQVSAPIVLAAETAPEAPPPATGSFTLDYKLGAGDRIRLIVYGEDALSGEYMVDGTGIVSLPLIGQVQALGRTLREFETDVATKLREGYLRDPKVSAEVTSFRPVYIHGEVTKPGSFPYVDGMTVPNAIAVAGGYTYRASTSSVYITRGEGAEEQEFPATNATKVLPGDIIRVGERFF